MKNPRASYTIKSRKQEDELIAKALKVLESRIKYSGDQLSSPHAVKNFLRLKSAQYDHEVFSCLFLDVKNRVIEHREMFRGTLDQAAVYPREVLKAVIELNAANIILSHNHPSGDAEPSTADKRITNVLKDLLSPLGVHLLDHIIVGVNDVQSFSEQGLL